MSRIVMHSYIAMALVSFHLAITPVHSLAQAWPAKPVRIYVSNGAGSAPDVVARLVSERLSKTFNQQFLIDNRPGGEQTIAASLAAKSAPDGYTFFFATNDSLVANQFRLKTLPYDIDRDFAPVANVVGSAAFVVVVNGDLPVKTFPDLAAMARAAPGNVTMGYTVGLSDIIAQWLNKLAGIDMLRVPYKQNTQANQAAVSGEVNAIVTSYLSIVPLVTSGRLRVIGVTGSERYPLLPEVPALSEAYPGLIIEGWFFFVAPAGTPADIVQRMNREVDRVVAEPEIVQRIRNFHFTPGPAMTPKAIEDRIRDERGRWRKIVQDIGLQPQ
ncbi:MAG: Bug family tripartite tricarboxylate transporter substrate binding protein [Burkholderiales bacterium]